MPDEIPSSESTLVQSLRERIKVPREIEEVLNDANDVRQWMKKVLHQDHPDTVVTHHVLRNQEAKLSHLTATQPRTNIKPRNRFLAPAGQPEMTHPSLVRFGETVELLLNFFAERGRLRDALNIAAREADTVDAGWVKLIWRDDPERTPNGSRVFDQSLLNSQRYRWLRDRFRAGEFTEDDHEYESMKALEQGLRTDIVRQLQQQAGESEVVEVNTEDGTAVVLSESPLQVRIRELIDGAEITDEELAGVPRFLGFDFEVIDIEDIRVDWSIDRPEQYHLSSGIRHRTRMKPQDIVERWGLSPERAAEINALADPEADHQSSGVLDKHRQSSVNNPDDSASGFYDKYVSVWECWEREDNRVYLWAEGTDFLLDQYTPRNVGPQWFPFFYLWFHEMSGYFYAPSTVKLSMSLQDEVNSIRTHDRVFRRATLPRLFSGKGVLTEHEKAKYETGSPLEMIEVERPDEVQQYLWRFDGVPYNPAMASTQDVFLDLQLTNGMPTSGLGGVGNAELATEVAFAGEQLQTQIDRAKFLFNAVLHRIMTEMAHIIVRSLPYENAVAIAGPGLEFPLSAQERESMLLDLLIEIDTSPTGRPNASEELEHLQVVANIFAGQGLQVDPAWMAARVSHALNVNTDWQSMIAAVNPLPTTRPQDAPSDGPPTGDAPGPAPGTPTGGLGRTPTTDELPGGQTPR